MKICIHVFILFILLANGFSFGQSYKVTDEGAWCWFADPRAIHHENKSKKINKTYIGYIDVHGNIKAMQYDFVKKEQTEILIRSYFQPDDHNNPTFLILPDDRVMVFYSRHTDERCFYYRITQQPGDLRTLGKEIRLETDHNTTYPSAFILSDDPNHIYLCWRGINWHPTIAKLSLPDDQDRIHFSDKPYQILQSTGARPYAKYVSNGKDKIFMAYNTGHPDNERVNFLYFSYIDIRSFSLCDIKGQQLSKIDKSIFKVNTLQDFMTAYPSVIVDSPTSRDWVWQIVVDKKDVPAIAFVRINEDKKKHDYHYAKWNGVSWQKTFIAAGGSKFHQTENLELCYSGGMAIDPDDVNNVYCAVPKIGNYGKVYELIKYVLNDKGKLIDSVEITKNSRNNNVRPYVISNSKQNALRLTWMHGDYFDWIVSKERKGYPTAIFADFKGFKSKSKKVFTYKATVKLDTVKYYGKIVSFGNVSYELDKTTMVPSLIVNDEKYVAANKLVTADSWANAPRGTNGKWYSPTKLSQVDLVIVYEKGYISIFVNGLLHQYENIGMIDVKNMHVSSDHHLKKYQ